MGKSRSVNNIQIAEPLFLSVQGEGRFSGYPSYFLRFSGCNLRCVWCDTKYSWGKGIDFDLNKLTKIKRHHFVLTGGEPMLYQDKWKFLKKYHEIELAGLIKKITESGEYELPYTEAEVNEYAQMAEFNWEDYDIEIDKSLDKEFKTVTCPKYGHNFEI